MRGKGKIMKTTGKRTRRKRKVAVTSERIRECKNKRD